MNIEEIIESFTEEQANLVCMMLDKQKAELCTTTPEFLVTYSRRCFDNTVQLRTARMTRSVLNLFESSNTDDRVSIIDIKKIGERKVC